MTHLEQNSTCISTLLAAQSLEGSRPRQVRLSEWRNESFEGTLCHFLDSSALWAVTHDDQKRLRVVAVGLLARDDVLRIIVGENYSVENAPKLDVFFTTLWDHFRDIVQLGVVDLLNERELPPPVVAEHTRLRRFLVWHTRATVMKRFRKLELDSPDWSTYLAGLAGPTTVGASPTPSSRLATALSALKAAAAHYYAASKARDDAAKRPAPGLYAKKALIEKQREDAEAGQLQGLDEFWDGLLALCNALPQKTDEQHVISFLGQCHIKVEDIVPWTRALMKLVSYVAAFNWLIRLVHHSDFLGKRWHELHVEIVSVVGQPLYPFEIDLDSSLFLTCFHEAYGAAAPERVNKVKKDLTARDAKRRGSEAVEYTINARCTYATTLVHCEVAVLHALLAGCNEGDELSRWQAPIQYVGVSKLSCLPCNKYFTAVNLALTTHTRQSMDIVTAGTHGSTNIPWSLPAAVTSMEDGGITVLMKMKQHLMEQLGQGDGNISRRLSGSSICTLELLPHQVQP